MRLKGVWAVSALVAIVASVAAWDVSDIVAGSAQESGAVEVLGGAVLFDSLEAHAWWGAQELRVDAASLILVDALVDAATLCAAYEEESPGTRAARVALLNLTATRLPVLSIPAAEAGCRSVSMGRRLVGYCDALGPRIVLAFDEDEWRRRRLFAGTVRLEADWDRGAECGIFVAHRGPGFELLASGQPVAARMRSAPNTFIAFQKSLILPAMRATLTLQFTSVVAFSLSVLHERHGKISHPFMLIVLWGNAAIGAALSVVSALHGWGTASPPLVVSAHGYFLLLLIGLSSGLDCLLAALWNNARDETAGQTLGGRHCTLYLSHSVFFGALSALVALLGVITDVLFATQNNAAYLCLLVIGLVQFTITAVNVVGAFRLMCGITALTDAEMRSRPLLARLSRAACLSGCTSLLSLIGSVIGMQVMSRSPSLYIMHAGVFNILRAANMSAQVWYCVPTPDAAPKKTVSRIRLPGTSKQSVSRNSRPETSTSAPLSNEVCAPRGVFHYARIVRSSAVAPATSSLAKP